MVEEEEEEEEEDRLLLSIPPPLGAAALRGQGGKSDRPKNEDIGDIHFLLKITCYYNNSTQLNERGGRREGKFTHIFL